MIQQAIREIAEGKNLSYEMMTAVMKEIMTGNATNVQMAAFLTGLRIKGETVEEITACANVMREEGVKLNPKKDVLDIVGTGGDEVGSFNISTTSAFLIAAAGVPVAKHGNRSVSSKSGAADVLERLGVNLALTPEQNQKVLEETGICFLFAQKYHPAMRFVGPVRRELGIRTIFNILGPLANPAAAPLQIMGVYSPGLLEPMARVLSNLGVKRGFVVCGLTPEGKTLDEITLTGTTRVCEIEHGILTSYDVIPEEYGMSRCSLKELVGGTPEENAEITRGILNGTITGPKRDVVVINAAFALYAADKRDTIEECIQLANEMIESGKAKATLERFVEMTQSV